MHYITNFHFNHCARKDDPGRLGMKIVAGRRLALDIVVEVESSSGHRPRPLARPAGDERRPRPTAVVGFMCVAGDCGPGMVFLVLRLIVSKPSE